MSLRVSIIGNNAFNHPVSDGGRIKLRLYEKCLRSIGAETNVIDLCQWKFRFLSIVHQIRKAISNRDVILIMAGPNGCRFIIPIVNKLNSSHKSRVVFCPLGIGTIDKVVRNLPEEKLANFMNCSDFSNLEDEKMKESLAQLDLILPQNEQIFRVYQKFYKLENLELLMNFRLGHIVPKVYEKHSVLKLIFAARVCEEKGIFDLIEAVNGLNKINPVFRLDVYGQFQFKGDEESQFFGSLSEFVQYKGVVGQTQMISVMKEYDVFCLPTKYYGEGTSGSLVEAQIAGTTVLVSGYNQAATLIEDGVTGYIYKFGSVESLKEKLLYLYSNQEAMFSAAQNGQKIAEKYLFENNKDHFEECIFGVTK